MQKILASLYFVLAMYSPLIIASSTMSESDLSSVEKKAIESTADKENLQKVAVTLANYEFEANKLVDLVDEQQGRESINDQANRLIALSEEVLDWANFRLEQCVAYLDKSRELKALLNKIS
ncbi:MAG: hypothetical protein MI673_03360, partial [Thiotrichales bacterium]|nr:hypothetical protein [Thiotrichales bacterium]